MLSQGEHRDVAVNLNTYWILQRHSAVSLTQHGFFVYISDHSNAELTRSTLIFTAVTQNHGDSRKSRHTTKIAVKLATVTVIVNTRLFYSANKCYHKCSQFTPTYTTLRGFFSDLFFSDLSDWSDVDSKRCQYIIFNRSVTSGTQRRICL